MNFLEITVSSKINLHDLNNWKIIPLNKDVNATDLAAIVLKEDDAKSFQLAQDLQKSSSLDIPIIKVSHETLTKADKDRIVRCAQNYANKVLPGFLTDLINFAKAQPISFTTPGHHNGQYYDKYPAGRVFNRFFGKNLMYADTSDTVPELGDTMTHQGTPLIAEQKAAKTYHADKVYFCTNGTTSANTICANAILRKNDLVLFDRNNHKSLYNSALIMTGAKPIYIRTDRNPLGLIGEMEPQDLNETNLRNEAAKIDPEKAKQTKPFRLAVVQAETYDGLFYDARWIINKIGKLCDYILFDCAWGGFESFIPIMRHLSPLLLKLGPTDPGILVTQSLHKQQAGMAQASQILKKDKHIKGQARYVDHKHFNHTYLKFVTSSYSYPLYASITVNSYITASSGNKRWWQDTLRLGIQWRKTLLKKAKLFKPLVFDDFNKISTDELMSNSKYWSINPNDYWHGFKKVASGEAMMDPMKITVVTPGIDIKNARYENKGIPSPIVSKFLMEKNIIPAKNDLNSLLFLLTPGDNKKELTKLLDAFLDFEKLYLTNAPLVKAIPKLAQNFSKRYQGYTLPKLCQEMHNYYKSYNTFTLQKKLFNKKNMQDYVMTPIQADTLFMHNQSELVDLDKIVGRVAAEGALPYPPGVFIVAPGEKWSKVDKDYFKDLAQAIEQFPGFTPEIQGVYLNKEKNGHLHVQAEVLKETN